MIWDGVTRCDVTWCDVTWRDVMWRDVTWRDVMWRDVTWCDLTWCDVTWRDVTLRDVTWCMWNDVTWCDMTWRDVTWRDVMWHDMTWCDVTWRDVVWRDVMWREIMWYDIIYIKIKKDALYRFMVKMKIVHNYCAASRTGSCGQCQPTNRIYTNIVVKKLNVKQSPLFRRGEGGLVWVQQGQTDRQTDTKQDTHFVIPFRNAPKNWTTSVSAVRPTAGTA
jgi:hypothetical protein